MCQRDRACHLWGFNSIRLCPNKRAAFLTKVPINKVTHYPELAEGVSVNTLIFHRVAKEERGFVPALIWHGVESKVKARRAALHLTARGEVGKLFLQKPREHTEKQWEQWHPIRGLTGQLHYLLMRVTTQGRELHGRRKMLETGVTFFFFFATTTCLFAKRDNAHGAILS